MPQAPDGGLRFQLQLSTEQLLAIGHVTAQWAFLESGINTEIRWLLERPENCNERVNFQSRFSKRTARWVELAARSFKRHPSLLRAVELVSGQAARIKPDRDEIAHGKMSMTGVRLKSREGRIIEISETLAGAHEIEDLACRISAINERLYKLQVALQRFRKRP